MHHTSEVNIDLSVCVSINQRVVIKPSLWLFLSEPVSMLTINCHAEENGGFFFGRAPGGLFILSFVKYQAVEKCCVHGAHGVERWAW